MAEGPPRAEVHRGRLWTALSYAPLAVVAAAYRAAGAEVWNLDLAAPAAVAAPHGCGLG